MIDVFEECRKIAAELTNNEASARNMLIQLLAKIANYNEQFDNAEEKIKYPPILNHLLRNTGLYPYMKESFLFEDRCVYELFSADIGGGHNAILHKKQSELLKALLDGKNLAISAPTSFGKSFVIDAFIAIKKPKNVVIIVPTIALTDETRRRLYKKFANEYKIITTSDIPLGEKNIFIFPQERALGYLKQITELDILVVDEFYKADSKYEKDRSASLLKAIAHFGKTAKQRYYLAPNIQTIHDNPFTEGMEFIHFDLNTVFLEKHDLYKEINKNKEKKTKVFLQLLKGLQGKKTLIYAGSHPEIDAISITLLAETSPSVTTGRLHEFATWLGKNYDSTWQLPKLISRKTGLHSARLHRHLTQLQVKLFEKEQNGLERLVSTTSIVEGVNTSAENIILWRNKKGNSKLDDFTYRNIIGRGGRMFRHFIGQIYLLEPPPKEDEQTLDLNINDDVLMNFEDLADEFLTQEQIKKLKASQEELSDVIGEECYQEIFKENMLQNTEFSLFKKIAINMKENTKTWNGLNFLNSSNPQDWDFLLYKILKFQSNIWGKHKPFVEFVKILSLNWNHPMPELLDKASAENISIDDFFELERIVAFNLSTLLQDVNVVQKSVLRHLGVDLTPMIKKLTYAFLPPVVYQLEEYGLPRMISRKIHDAGVINFEDEDLTLHDALDKFREIGKDNLCKRVNELDDFDKYIIKYFYDGISLSSGEKA